MRSIRRVVPVRVVAQRLRVVSKESMRWFMGFAGRENSPLRIGRRRDHPAHGGGASLDYPLPSRFLARLPAQRMRRNRRRIRAHEGLDLAKEARPYALQKVLV